MSFHALSWIFIYFLHFVGFLRLGYSFYFIALNDGEDDDVQLVESIGGIDGDHQYQKHTLISLKFQFWFY